MTERILIVAPAWVGDAILSEPLIALLRQRFADAAIDVLAPAWCGAVYARMRGVESIVTNPFGHGRFDLAGRRALGRQLGSATPRYTQAYVLPNSWKSALVPWLAGIPERIGYQGEARYGLLNDRRHLGHGAPERLVDRFAALASPRGTPPSSVPAPVLVPDDAARAAAVQRLGLATVSPIAILCPGAEYGPAKRWPATHFAALAQRLGGDGYHVWLIGSPKDAAEADAIMAAYGADAGPGPSADSGSVVNLIGKTDLGTAIDLLSLADVVVSNDSGLMHAAAAVGVRLVALFGSSSPGFTPPLSPLARVARIDIECSPCFKRDCPLGHLRCLRELSPDAVYDLARRD